MLSRLLARPIGLLLLLLPLVTFAAVTPYPPYPGAVPSVAYAGKPGLMMGPKVGTVLFKHVTMNGAIIKTDEQLKRTGFDLSVPVKFEP